MPLWEEMYLAHKCKCYYPERVNKPQQMVANELCAMRRRTAAKSASQ